MKAGHYLQPSLPVNTISTDEENPGGLDLGRFWAVLRRRALLIASITAGIMCAAWLKALTDKPTYIARFEVLVQPASAETVVISSVPETLTSEESQTQETGIDPDLLKILTSTRVILPVSEELQPQYPDLTYNSIFRNLNVSAVGKDSNIIQVLYQGEDPDKVTTVLKQLSEAYLEYSLESRQINIRRGLDFVERKLPDLRGRVEILQGELERLRQQHSLIDPTSRGQQLSGQVSSFSQQQLEAQVQLQQTRAINDDLQRQLTQQANEAAASSVLTQNSRYQSVLNRLIELDAEIAEASTLYLENTEDMQALREERRNLLAILEREGQQSQREVISRIRELEAQEQALQETLDSLNSGVNELSTISRQYTDIQRELEVATTNLNQFLMKQAALEIDAAQREVPWELLTPPTNPQALAESVPRNLVLGAIIGLLMGTGAALVLDRFADVIHTSEEVKRITRLPLLGSIPINESLEAGTRVNLAASLKQVGSAIMQTEKDPTKKGTEQKPYPAVIFFESFRSLFANIRLLNSDAPLRSLVISSTVAGEGKSTVAAYLAQAAAAMGQRVLLVDTDLRHPRLHEYLGLSNSVGLIDVLTDALDIRYVVQRSPLEPNLFILTAGVIPPDPTRSLSSQKMQQLMKHAQDRFDLVIYDTPPLLGFADAYLIAAHTNGILLVTELGKLKRSSLEQVLEQFRVSNTSALGVVVQKQASL